MNKISITKKHYPVIFKMIKFLNINTCYLFLILFSIIFSGCQNTEKTEAWNEKYDFIYDIEPIVFHYDHGILAGSYPQNQETTEVAFNDVCNYLGHVCLCGAGGYKISELAINSLKKPDETLEKGDFILISSRDHTVSDVVSFVLGCSRRNNPEKNQYFIDTKIEAPKREYHYYIGYSLQEKAVHIIYRKHLLIGNELMDRLWKVELAYEENPASVSQADFELYQNTMFNVINDVLSNQKIGLFDVELIDYNEFLLILKGIKVNNNK
ncbi:MAG: hypothetical protein K8R54_15035 [Bacteroidales bacterium]|nr:hypothetical protein [Bacteroidales bacterium]